MRKNPFTYAGYALIVLALAFCTVKFLSYTMSLAELNECATWQSQSHAYRNWYSSDWQRAQCAHYGIALQ